MLTGLPPEMIHHILFSFDTSARDVLHTALTCHQIYASIFGMLGAESEYDLDQMRAKKGVYECAARGWVRAARMALSRGYGDPSVVHNYALNWAARKGHSDLVGDLLSDPRVDLRWGASKAVQACAKNGHVETLIILLADPRVDPDGNDNYAIRLAADKGHAEIVSLLLADYRVDPTGHRNYALAYAAARGHVDVVALLLADPRVDPMARNGYAFRAATRNNHVDVLNLLRAHQQVRS